MNIVKTTLGALACLLVSSGAIAQETVFIIRHAEQDTAYPDPGILPEGRERAADWAKILRPSGLDLVVTSKTLRARTTGEIIAEARGVPLVEFSVYARLELIEFLRENHPEDVILVVGHTQSIPLLLRDFGYSDSFKISKSAYGWLFIVTPLENSPPVVTRLNINLR